MFGIKLAKPPTANAVVALPKPLPPSKKRFPDSLPLLSFAPGEPYTAGQSFEGTQIFGGTGSGKTSSTGRALALGMCRQGYGGLVLCAKPGEKDLWLRYAKETGRSESVIVFDGSGRERLNFLDYCARRMEHFDARNVVEMFTTIMEAASGGGEEAGGEQQLWVGLTKELLTNVVAILHSAWGRVTLTEMLAVIDSAPASPQEAEDAAWQQRSFCFKTIVQMHRSPAHRLPMHDLEAHGNFFRKRWAARHGKIRTSIEATFSSSAYPFQTGYLHTLFGTTTTAVPEMAHHGAILIIDLPIKSHGKAGILAQHIWKFLFQKATEERKDTKSDTVRPVFLWADECQFFVSSYDREFQSTARSSRAATVYITQNLPTYYAAMNAPGSARDTVDALMGNLQTKIFHQNMDAQTNQWASAVVGKSLVWMDSYGATTGTGVNDGTSDGYSDTSGHSVSDGKVSFSGSGGRNKGKTRGTSKNDGTSHTVSQQLHDELQSNVFPTLRKGGGRQPPEAIVMQGGRTFRANGGRAWLRCQVRQG